MEPYPKIDTVFVRDPETKFRTLLEGQYSNPAFEYLASDTWRLTEKVDGMNIRIVIDDSGVHIRGRTDNTQVPPHLMEVLAEFCLLQNLRGEFPDGGCLYGEGYGPKIQGGSKYRDDPGFVLFDVKVGQWWLQHEDVGKVADKLSLPSVPTLKWASLNKMIRMCRNGFDSTWGDFRAEGIVARPLVDLFDRHGNRVITKLKCKDFATE